MNRLLVSAAALAVLCVAGAAQAAGLSLTQGQVISRTAGKVTLHDYVRLCHSKMLTATFDYDIKKSTRKDTYVNRL